MFIFIHIQKWYIFNINGVIPYISKYSIDGAVIININSILVIVFMIVKATGILRPLGWFSPSFWEDVNFCHLYDQEITKPRPLTNLCICDMNPLSDILQILFLPCFCFMALFVVPFFFYPVKN